MEVGSGRGSLFRTFFFGNRFLFEFVEGKDGSFREAARYGESVRVQMGRFPSMSVTARNRRSRFPFLFSWLVDFEFLRDFRFVNVT